MSDYRIHRDNERGVWLVQLHGDHPRHVASFDTQDEARQYVERQEAR